jgi:hypothetical protein
MQGDAQPARRSRKRREHSDRTRHSPPCRDCEHAWRDDDSVKIQNRQRERGGLGCYLAFLAGGSISVVVAANLGTTAGRRARTNLGTPAGQPTTAQTLAFAAERGSSGVFDSLWRAGGGGGKQILPLQSSKTNQYGISSLPIDQLCQQ